MMSPGRGVTLVRAAEEPPGAVLKPLEWPGRGPGVGCGPPVCDAGLGCCPPPAAGPESSEPVRADLPEPGFAAPGLALPEPDRPADLAWPPSAP